MRDALEVRDLEAHVYVGMRYWHPFTEEAIEQVRRGKEGLDPRFQAINPGISELPGSIRLLRKECDLNPSVSQKRLSSQPHLRSSFLAVEPQ